MKNLLEIFLSINFDLKIIIFYVQCSILFHNFNYYPKICKASCRK